MIPVCAGFAQVPSVKSCRQTLVKFGLEGIAAWKSQATYDILSKNYAFICIAPAPFCVKKGAEAIRDFIQEV
jgi:hypothetical protein